MDGIDADILNIIQGDAKTANAEIARKLGMAPSGILERVRKLESSGIIEKYEARLNAKKLGLGLMTLIQVYTEEPLGSIEVGRRLASIPEIQEVHAVTGKANYILKARVRDSDHHNELLARMGEMGAKDARTTMVLETIKETLKLDTGRP